MAFTVKDWQEQLLSAGKAFICDHDNLAGGLFAGSMTAGVSHPLDRAVYLSVTHNRALFSMENFRSPLQGLTQTLVARTFSYGLYYVFQGSFRESLYPMLKQRGAGETAAQCAVGLSAGFFAGTLTNGLSAIKHQSWSAGPGYTFRRTASEMMRAGGINPFVNGTRAVICRDMVFGSTYEVTRSLIRLGFSGDHRSRSAGIICDGTAAIVATVASSPLNYAKNMQYATPPGCRPPSIRQALTALAAEARVNSSSVFSGLGLFQRRLSLGVVSARVGVSVATGQLLFDVAKERIHGLR